MPWFIVGYEVSVGLQGSEFLLTLCFCVCAFVATDLDTLFSLTLMSLVCGYCFMLLKIHVRKGKGSTQVWLQVGRAVRGMDGLCV